MTVELYHPELRGVFVSETEISCLEDGFSYRGYDVGELCQAGGFLETAYLLLHERLPGGEELADFRSLMLEAAEPSPAVEALTAILPMSVRPLEMLRTAVSVLGHEDWTPSDETVDSNRARAARLVAQMPLLAASALGTPGPHEFCPERSFAGNVARLLGVAEPSSLHERAVETVLVLLADHELNTPTFAARVVASRGADVYSAVTAALAAMCGPTALPDTDGWFQGMLDVASPGGAGDFVERMLARAPDAVRPEVPGFGHPVYDETDPRAVMLERVCEDLAVATGHEWLEEIASAVESAVWQQTGLSPNVEWPRRRLMHYVGLPAEAGDLLFCCSRVVGWCANAIEQHEEGTTYRPRARYRGAEGLRYTSLGDDGRD